MDSVTEKLERLVSVIDAFTDWIGRSVAWGVLVIVLMTMTVVVMRYVFNVGSVFLQEAVLYFHNYIIMLGASYALLRGAHVRVDIFYRPMSERKKAWVDIAGFIVFLLPTCVFIFYIAWDYVIASWSILEKSQESGGVNAKYIFKTSLLLMPLLMILQGAGNTLKSILILCKPVTDAPSQPHYEREVA